MLHYKLIIVNHKTTENKQSQWIGHLIRMKENTQVKRIWEAKITRKKQKVWPKKKWYKILQQTLAERQITKQKKKEDTEKKREMAHYSKQN